MNIYRHTFIAKCPNNDRQVDYHLTIRANRMIMVEDIQATTSDMTGFHETFADMLFAKFGGQQTLTAHHHGTDVETIRP
jgi:hypothetical protein